MGIPSKASVPDLPAQADRIPADCGCCLRRIGTEWNSSGCGIYSDDCSDCNVSSGGSMITQLAQIYGKDSRYASVINVMSVIFCIITMPVMVLSYEMLIAL